MYHANLYSEVYTGAIRNICIAMPQGAMKRAQISWPSAFFVMLSLTHWAAVNASDEAVGGKMHFQSNSVDVMLDCKAA
jgi:hypothetical protein